MRLVVSLAALALGVACNRSPRIEQPHQGPRADATADPSTDDPTPSSNNVELPESRRERQQTPPAAGLEYWADAPMTTEAFLAQAKATGIVIEHTVEVSSIPELLGALAPNTAIVLAPGQHEFEDSNILAEPDEQAKLPDWSALSPHYDGGEIHDIHDLVILGPGPDPTLLLQADGYAHALSFRNVENVGLHALTIGHHPEQGWCRGGVVKVVEGKNILVTDSTLFGSGTEGLTLITVDGLRLRDSVITNSSEQFSTFSQSRGIAFERVRVAGNHSDLLRGFAIYRSTFTLSDSVIADNKKLGWSSSDSYSLLFAIDGTFDWGTGFEDDPRPLDKERRRSEVQLRNTTIDGERFDKTL